MSAPLVKAEGISKKFCKSLKHSMIYGVKNIASAIAGRAIATETLRDKEFWAIDDISFELNRGECLGLIGPNGSGKSTLLKVLNGILSPDRGRVAITGRVGALIEVSAGFHPMLTGRENIFVNGAILGFSKREIDGKLDAIIDFAGVEDFIDTPVKHYSSGMYVRLGFAIAAQMEPDVLIIDEVLTVGDIGFRTKCFNAIDRIAKNSAVIFVTHHMPQVSRICTRICVLEKGKIIYNGDSIAQGINKYYSRFQQGKPIVSGSGKAVLHGIALESGGREDVDTLEYRDELVIHLHFSVDTAITAPVVAIAFMTQELQVIAQSFSSFNQVSIANRGDAIRMRVRVPELLFVPGIYLITVTILDNMQKEVLVQCYGTKRFQIIGDFIAMAPLQIPGEWIVL